MNNIRIIKLLIASRVLEKLCCLTFRDSSCFYRFQFVSEYFGESELVISQIIRKW